MSAPLSKRARIDSADSITGLDGFELEELGLAEDVLPLSQTDSAGRPRLPTQRATSASAPPSAPDSCLDVDHEPQPLPQALPLPSELSAAAMQEPASSARTIHDPVHGQILLEPALIAVLDTAEYQRLRDLKQLGCTTYVYPSACHSRFEHCLGVSYLAGSMFDHLLRQDNNRFELDERDRLCVKLAGLCHDLGHGPFSHMFELFVNRVRAREGRPHWEHEQASIELFDFLLRENKIDLRRYGLRVPDDVNFIKLLIAGLKTEAAWPADIGRPASKRFLLDIVANKRNGLDVDKLDYFMRDAISALGSPPIGCDIKRLIRSSRAMEVNGQTQICFEEKLALGIFDIFRLRAWLHKYVYQHHTVKVVEEMVCDVFGEANEHWRLLADSAGKPCRLSDSVDDMFTFSRLGDWVLNAIEASVDPALAKAREILYRLRCRYLYAAVNQPVNLPEALRKLTEDQIKAQILQHVARPNEPQSLDLEANGAVAVRAAADTVARDLVVHFVHINYGSKSKSGEADNPVLHVNFFNPKLNPEQAAHINEKRMPLLFMPQAYEEKLLYVYSRADESHAALEQAYNAWRRQTASTKTPGGRHAASVITPLVANNPASPSKAAIRLARHASGNGLPRLMNQSPLKKPAEGVNNGGGSEVAAGGGGGGEGGGDAAVAAATV